MKILAEVAGSWYGSPDFGTGVLPHGSMTGRNVTSWVKDSSISTTTGTWYLSLTGLPGGYDWRDGTQWSTTPLSGLPSGDVTRFGIAWKQDSNSDAGAVDNFVISDVPEPATLALLGLGGIGLILGRKRK